MVVETSGRTSVPNSKLSTPPGKKEEKKKGKGRERENKKESGINNGQFQVTVFGFVTSCYVIMNIGPIHCLNHRQAKDYITRRNETERKLLFERRHCFTNLYNDSTQFSVCL